MVLPARDDAVALELGVGGADDAPATELVQDRRIERERPHPEPAVDAHGVAVLVDAADRVAARAESGGGVDTTATRARVAVRRARRIEHREQRLDVEALERR